MSTFPDPDAEFERRASTLLLDVLIRAALVLALAMLCYQVFSPFLSLMTWAVILAVTLYPLHQSVAARIGTIELAAYQICFEIWNTLALTLDAIAIAGQAMIGRMLGAPTVLTVTAFAGDRRDDVLRMLDVEE